jgi:hypothetical protein
LKLSTFLHVVDKVKSPDDPEHPFQGWLPYLKLVWQPSVQLLEIFSIAASFSIVEPDPAMIASDEADDVRAVRV